MPPPAVVQPRARDDEFRRRIVDFFADSRSYSLVVDTEMSPGGRVNPGRPKEIRIKFEVSVNPSFAIGPSHLTSHR
jgi:hypothetical protein